MKYKFESNKKVVRYTRWRISPRMKPSELSAFRKTKKMTQNDFAVWLGCSKHAVISWENGRNTVPDWVIARIRADRPVLNPKLTLEQFRRAEKTAAENGKELEDWIADLVIKSLKATVAAGLLWNLIGTTQGSK